MKKFLEEFKAFAIKGNMIDLAIGVVIGGAFQTIIKSLVEDIIMPLIGILMGNIDVSELKATLTNPLTDTTVSVTYGNFLQNMINFLIMAFAIFLFVKAINKFHHKKAEEPAAPTKTEELLTEILDTLKNK